MIILTAYTYSDYMLAAWQRLRHWSTQKQLEFGAGVGLTVSESVDFARFVDDLLISSRVIRENPRRWVGCFAPVANPRATEQYLLYHLGAIHTRMAEWTASEGADNSAHSRLAAVFRNMSTSRSAVATDLNAAFQDFHYDRSAPASVPPAPDPEVERVELIPALDALGSRLGKHLLKSVWALINGRLATHLAKEFNQEQSAVQASLDRFADDLFLR